MKSNSLRWGLVSLVVLLTAAVLIGTANREGLSNSLSSVNERIERPFATPTPAPKDKRDLSMYGSVRYEGAESFNLENDSRRQISERYDRRGWVYKAINNPATASVSSISEEVPSPLLPFDESALIVVGRVIRSEAFLSNDKGGVYSEFTILVSEKLKSNNNENKEQETIIADREGGVVIYSGGQRVLYQSTDHQLPQVGSQYLFFLANDCACPNYYVMSAFQLTSSGIRQLDPGPQLGNLKDLGVKSFVDEVKKNIRTKNQ